MSRATRKIRVTFRASDEKLTSMFAEAFPTVSAAKAAMKADAKPKATMFVRPIASCSPSSSIIMSVKQ